MNNLTNDKDSALQLAFMEHLSYIIECLASDVPGDAKYELGILIERLDRKEYIVPDTNFVIENLKTAQTKLREGNVRHGATDLSRVSRSVWKALVP